MALVPSSARGGACGGGRGAKWSSFRASAAFPAFSARCLCVHCVTCPWCLGHCQVIRRRVAGAGARVGPALHQPFLSLQAPGAVAPGTRPVAQVTNAAMPPMPMPARGEPWGLASALNICRLCACVRYLIAEGLPFPHSACAHTTVTLACHIVARQPDIEPVSAMRFLLMRSRCPPGRAAYVPPHLRTRGGAGG